MAKVAVILSGCGYLDGAEIREAVLTLLYLDQHNAEVSVFAPDKGQHHTIDHVTGDEGEAPRNVLLESARIARGNIAPLSALDEAQFDALVIPGGYGVAKNLSDLAFKGPEATVDAEFSAAIKAFHAAGKPIGAICIAPAVLAAALKGSGVKVTIGEDEGTASVIESFGCVHEVCPSDGVVIDKVHKVISCSAYMREDRISSIAKGIEKVVANTIEFANELKMAS